MKDTLRATCNRILAKMIAAGHDVVASCDSWTDDEVYDFYDNYADHYCD